MAKTNDEIEADVARAMWGGFYRCPTTGRIIEALEGDDKALCSCGRSNPRVPSEETARTGVHIVRFLDVATAEDYVAQRSTRATGDVSRRLFGKRYP